MWTTLFFAILLALYAVFVGSVVTVVLLENRQPAKTIAWTVVLIMLPVVGLVIFYFFGQNIRKERYISRRQARVLTGRMLAEVQGISPCQLGDYAPLACLFRHTDNAFVTPVTDMQGYTTGAQWVLALLRDVAGAQSHIHLQTYIIEDDALGRLVRDALCDAARRGVEVRLLYDDVGCWRVPARFFAPLAEAGGIVTAFMPVRFPSLTHKVNYRNHRKLCVVDGRIAYIGGMNLALRYLGRKEAPWRDLHLRLTGAAVAALQRIFLTDWCFARGTFVSDRRYFPAPAEGAPHTPSPGAPAAQVQIVQSGPVSPYPEIMYGLTWAVQHARRYIYLQTPYFMPTEPVLQALQTAAMSGVDVRLMVPAKPDAFWLRYINDSYFSAVLEAGIRVFVFTAGFLHTKAAVSDDAWCTTGSSNFDFRSFENNFEANAFIYSARIAREMRASFERDQTAHCSEITLAAWRQRPYRRRVLESYTRILAPLL